MYKTGGFNFPTGTGDYSVTGLGFRPQAVILIGGNRPELNALVVNAVGPGCFLSMNALDWSDGVTIRHLMLAPFGKSDAGRAGYRGYESGPISMVADGTTGATVDYKADSITFGADGFTIHVSTAASGVRPITWLAWGGDDGEGGPAMHTGMRLGGGGTFMPAWKGRSSLTLNTLAAAGFGEDYVNGESYMSWGSGHYPAWAEAADAYRADKNWKSMTVYDQIQMSSPLGRQGFQEWFVFTGDVNPWWFSSSGVISTLGPALIDGNRRFRPYLEGGSFQTFISEGGGSAQNYHADLWFTGEGWCGSVPSIGSVGGTATIVTPVAFKVYDALIFATLNGAYFAGGPGGNQAFGFGILGRDFQGCVSFGKDGSFYQSDTECVANCSNSGVNAYSGEFLESGDVRLTCTRGGAVSNAVWTGFGSTVGAIWMPQSYRFLQDSDRPPIKN